MNRFDNAIEEVDRNTRRAIRQIIVVNLIAAAAIIASMIWRFFL